MNNPEFSAEFDVLYNNITSNQAPGLNEYEKSVFLTKAQAQLINEYFNSRTDGVGGGFDGSQKRQYDFSSLIKTANLPVVSSTILENISKIDKRSLCYTFPSDYFLAVNEMLSDAKYQYNVMPLSYNEYARLMLKPYAYPVKKGAWRLITGKVSYMSGEGVAGTSLSLTYIPIADNSEEPWDEFEDEAFFGQWIEYGPGGTTVTHNYTRLEEADSGAQLSNRYNARLYFTYHDNPYQLEVLTDGKGNYSVYLFRMGYIEMTDEQIAEIFNKLLPLVLPDYSNIKVADSDLNLFTKSSDSYSVFPETFDSEVGYTLTFPVGSMPLVEIIGRFADTPLYTLRYIKKPAPIILVDLRDENYEDLNIEGVCTVSECELPEETHQEILERAVALAKIAWAGGTATQVAAQQNREN